MPGGLAMAVFLISHPHIEQQGTREYLNRIILTHGNALAHRKAICRLDVVAKRDETLYLGRLCTPPGSQRMPLHNALAE